MKFNADPRGEPQRGVESGWGWIGLALSRPGREGNFGKLCDEFNIYDKSFQTSIRTFQKLTTSKLRPGYAVHFIII